MRHLNHKNTMRLHEVFESENSLYIIFELLQGGQLYDKIKVFLYSYLRLSINLNLTKLNSSLEVFFLALEKCTPKTSCIEILNLKTFSSEKREISTALLRISVLLNSLPFQNTFSFDAVLLVMSLLKSSISKT